jgi:glycosyltransferase involved in cell wall biosynthesis
MRCAPGCQSERPGLTDSGPKSSHWRERNVHLSLIGEGVNERWQRRAAQELELANILITGHVEDIEEVWSRYHALALASRYEGMPLVLVEVMLCGRPGIVTDAAGNRELVKDNKTAFG